MLVGSGSHVYEWVDGWAKLPSSVVLGYTHGVEVDRAGRIIIFNQSKDAVLIFTREGEFVKSWGAEFAKGAHGLYLSREKERDTLFLADYELHEVVKTTVDGEVIFRLGLPPRPDIYSKLEEFKPTDTCVAPNGDIYVFDGYGKPYIHRYNAKGEYLSSFGGPGSEKGHLNCPHGGWVDLRGKEPVLYVADRGNNRIQKFSLLGEHLGFVTFDLRLPCCFYTHGTETYIPDLFSRVTILDSRDLLVTHVGDNPGFWQTPGWPNVDLSLRTPGKFSSPHGLAVDSHGDIYVAEWVQTGRITKLVRQK